MHAEILRVIIQVYVEGADRFFWPLGTTHPCKKCCLNF